MPRAIWCRRRQAIGVAAFSLLTLVGCSARADDKQPPAEPVGLPQSWIWSAASGIPIDSADARTVRGWFESAVLFQGALVSYPGFPQATSADLLNELMPADDGLQRAGTERLLIRSITVTDGHLNASVCVDGWDGSYFTSAGKFHRAEIALVVQTLDMRKGGPTTASPARAGQALVADSAPSPVGGRPYSSWLKGPSDNVFGGWIAYNREFAAPPADCIAWFKKSHPTIKYPITYANDKRPNRPTSAPPPTLPASPGW
ncbi:hypothetical protein [Kribbella solani]|uniref:Uncharacterized protein n=1 Tax=Kribbella solani TaxID=236067 RepID=A0A841DLK6_9ACTN|nr:hypothetical protein [Kribbella solani]MBB5979984.1 hypothetical protein [Kribbella solani]